MKHGFHDSLSVDALRGDEWVTDETIRYFSSCCFLIVIPTGLVTDLASNPWWIRWLIPVNDDHRLSSALHDYLYGIQGRLAGRRWTRFKCDMEMFYASKTCDVPLWLRVLMLVGVRAGGWWSWHKCGERIKKNWSKLWTK